MNKKSEEQFKKIADLKSFLEGELKRLSILKEEFKTKQNKDIQCNDSTFKEWYDILISHVDKKFDQYNQLIDYINKLDEHQREVK